MPPSKAKCKPGKKKPATTAQPQAPSQVRQPLVGAAFSQDLVQDSTKDDKAKGQGKDRSDSTIANHPANGKLGPSASIGDGGSSRFVSSPMEQNTPSGFDEGVDRRRNFRPADTPNIPYYPPAALLSKPTKLPSTPSSPGAYPIASHPASTNSGIIASPPMVHELFQEGDGDSGSAPGLFGSGAPILADLPASASAPGVEAISAPGTNSIHHHAQPQNWSLKYGVNMRDSSICGRAECLKAFNDVKNEATSLGTKLRESQKQNSLNLVICEERGEKLRKADLQKQQHEEEIGDLKTSFNNLKRKFDALQEQQLEGKARRKKRRKSRSKFEVSNLGKTPSVSIDISTLRSSALVQILEAEKTHPHGGAIAHVGQCLLQPSFIIKEALVMVHQQSEALVAPWEENVFYAPVHGFFPNLPGMCVREAESNPPSLIYPLPPEQVLAGLGSASIGYTSDGLPVIPTCHRLSDSDVGVCTVDARVAAGTANLIGYQPRAPTSAIKEYEPNSHAWYAFNSEWDVKGLRKKASSGRKTPLAMDRMISRMFRKTLELPGFEMPKFVESGKVWKRNIVSLSVQRTDSPPGFQSADDLGLSAGETFNNSDLQIFQDSVIARLHGCTALGSIYFKTAMNRQNTRRYLFHSSLMRAMNACEFDPELNEPKYFSKRSKEARTARHQKLYGHGSKQNKGDPDLRKRYELFFRNDESGMCPGFPHVVQTSKGNVFSPAPTWKVFKGNGPGITNRWRQHNDRTCAAMRDAPSGSEFGFEAGVESVADDVLLSKAYWESHNVLPTEYKRRVSGALCDRLFNTHEVREVAVNFMGAILEMTNTIVDLPDFSDLWNKKPEDLRPEDLGFAKRIIGENGMMPLVVMEAESCVVLHSRALEALHDVKMSSTQHGALFRSILMPCALNISLEIYGYWMEDPRVVQFESKIPFEYCKYEEWMKQRLKANKSVVLTTKDELDEEDAELEETRADFDKHVEQTVSRDIHGYDHCMGNFRVSSSHFWSEADGCDYVVMLSEYFNRKICSWWGPIRDCFLGFYDPSKKFTGEFLMIPEKYRGNPIYDVLGEGPKERTDDVGSSKDSPVVEPQIDSGINCSTPSDLQQPHSPTSDNPREDLGCEATKTLQGPPGRHNSGPGTSKRAPIPSMFSGEDDNSGAKETDGQSDTECANKDPKNSEAMPSDDDDDGDDTLMLGQTQYGVGNREDYPVRKRLQHRGGETPETISALQDSEAPDQARQLASDKGTVGEASQLKSKEGNPNSRKTASKSARGGRAQPVPRRSSRANAGISGRYA